MGCFCALTIEALARGDQPEAAATVSDPPEPMDVPEVVPAVYAWLSDRLLGPEPARDWAPDPEWHDLELPDPPMPPAALAVLCSLVQAYKSAQTDFGLDLTDPDGQRQLSRIVGTLNRRTPLLAAMANDPRPWERAALLNDQLDAVRSAVEAAHIPAAAERDGEHGPPVAPWRPLIRKLRALAPLVSIGRMLDIDLGDAAATERVAELVRGLRTIELPPLADSLLVLRTIARVGAVARLRGSFGADPRPVPFDRVRRALERKAAEVRDLLPAAVRMEAGQLVGLPAREPSPSQFVNASTVAQAQRINPAAMRWRPPPYDKLDLLTVGAPVMTLARVMTGLIPSPIRQSPCGHLCDAGPVDRATALPGNETGAGRAA